MRVGRVWPVAGSSPCGGADPRHCGRRTHRAAGLHTLNQAFVEIVQTAKAHNVSTLSLADALVALAQNQASQHGDDAAFVAARAAWGGTLWTGAGRAAACDLTTKTTPFPALRTGRCRRRVRPRATAR